MDAQGSKEDLQLGRRMKEFKLIVLLTATVPPTLVALGTLSSYLCLLPFLAHILLLFFLYGLLANAFIVYDYFTPKRIEEIAGKTTRKELKAPLSPRDLVRGIFLIKIFWHYDSRSSGYIISLFLTILFLPTLIIDLALPLTSSGFLLISVFLIVVVWFIFSTLYTEERKYIPSEHDVLFEDILPGLNYYRRGMLWRLFRRSENARMLAMRIHTRLDDELKKYESGEKERPLSPDNVNSEIPPEIPPPYQVR